MKTKITLLTFTLFLLFTSFKAHKYYVSVTQLEFSSKSNRLEITIRIFIDDFEKALNTKYHDKINLATDQENSKTLNYIKKYCGEKVQVVLNGKPMEVVFLGKEFEDDVVICYLKVNTTEKIKTIDFYSTMLTEAFSEQQNLVHSNINNIKKSFMLTNREHKAAIIF